MKELDEEEKAAKSLRKQVQENLLKLAARIPAFMYLTDYREQTIKDVITQIEPELFKKVTGLSVKDFDVLASHRMTDPVLSVHSLGLRSVCSSIPMIRFD